jgi:hypothetical protein
VIDGRAHQLWVAQFWIYRFAADPAHPAIPIEDELPEMAHLSRLITPYDAQCAR